MLTKLSCSRLTSLATGHCSTSTKTHQLHTSLFNSYTVFMSNRGVVVNNEIRISKFIKFMLRHWFIFCFERVRSYIWRANGPHIDRCSARMYVFYLQLFNFALVVDVGTQCEFRKEEETTANQHDISCYLKLALYVSTNNLVLFYG